MAVGKVLLLLLKILGITLLVILGLLLFAILLVLFVPVRYKGKFRRKEAPQEEMTASILVSWGNPFLRLRFWLEEKKVIFTFRILGICLIDSRREKKPKKEKKPEKEKASEKKKKKEAGEKQAGEAVPVQSEIDEALPKTKVIVLEGDEKPPEPGRLPSEEGEAEEGGTKKESVFHKIFGKIKGFFEKIKEIIEKIRAIPEKLRKKAEQLKKNIRLLIKKKDKVVSFLTHEANKQVFGEAFGLLRKLFGHILPVKLKGSVVFGTGDPESTGKAFGIFAVFYPVYARRFTICPDFAEKRLEADVTFRGRIRAATLLWWGARFWFKKETRRFRKRFKRLRGSLKEKAE